MRAATVTFALSCAIALACGDNTGPGGRRLNILATNFSADTVGSSQSYELQVQVLAGNGDPLPGVEVEFTAVGGQFDPRVVFLVGGRDFTVAVDTTDETGRASAMVRPSGVKAGRAAVEVEVSAWGLEQTAHYDLLPGKPVTLAQIDVRSRFMIGDTFSIRASWYDRTNQNQSWEPIVCSSTAPEITLTGCKVTGTAMGPATIEVSPVANPQAVHTTPLAVVPRAQVAFNGAGGVTLANLDGTNARVLGGSYIPGDWYKAGHRLFAFGPTTAVPIYHLYVIDVNGNAAEWSVAMRGSAGEQEPELAPDEQWVYFSANLSANSGSEIWRAHVNGSNSHGIGPPSTEKRRDRSPSVSPDGLQLVYTANSNLQVLELATGAVRSLGVLGDSPIWSPTGEWIAFAGPQGLSIIKPDGSNRTILIPSSGSGTPPFGNHSPTDWSPDGKYVVGVRAYDVVAIFVLEVASGKLVYPHFAASNPIWRPVN